MATRLNISYASLGNGYFTGRTLNICKYRLYRASIVYIEQVSFI